MANNHIEQRPMAPFKSASTRRANKKTRRGSGRRDGKGVAKHVTGSVELASASSKCQDSTGEPGEICSGGECESTATSVEQPKPSTQAALPNSRMPAASHAQPPTASPGKCRGPRWNRRRGGQPARVDDILQQLAGGGLESVVAAACAALAASCQPCSKDQAAKGGSEKAKSIATASHSSCASITTVPSALNVASQDTSLTTSPRISCTRSDVSIEDAKFEEASKLFEPVEKHGASKFDPPVKGKGEDKPPSSCTGVACALQSYKVVCRVKHKTYADAVRTGLRGF
jgi:hypothetical protein